jgi:hypothetical protein
LNSGSEHHPDTGTNPPEGARLLAHLHGHPPAGQQLLLASTPRGVCQQIGLEWWAAVKLHEDGFLSFSPETTPGLDEAQEAELTFLGSLVVAGCDRRMLVMLLRGLSKPYAYDLRRIYYDWVARDWRIFPDPHAYPETLFSDWVEMLEGNRDAATLKAVLELTQDALKRALSPPAEGDLYPKPAPGR